MERTLRKAAEDRAPHYRGTSKGHSPMRKNIAKVIQAFRDGKPCKGDSKGTCWTDGATVFSYKMEIAFRGEFKSAIGDAETRIMVARYSAGPSRTTKSQSVALRLAFPKCEDLS